MISHVINTTSKNLWAFI